MVTDLARGVPWIVCMHYDRTPDAPEHFRLVLGYDRATNEIVYHEPAQSGAHRQAEGDQHFVELSPLNVVATARTAVRDCLEPVDRRRAARASPFPA